MIDIKDQCKGKWRSVLINLGIDREFLNGKHGPCIICGGRDRARWIKDREIYYCNQCEPKNPIDLAMAWLDKGFKETAEQIRNILGNCMSEPQKDKEREIRENRAKIEAIRKGLKIISPGTIAAHYIANRGLTVLPEKDCYFHPGLPYYDNSEKKGLFCAIVSRITDIDGNLCAYHITYLDEYGSKLDCSAPRKIKHKIKDTAGASIKLFEPDEFLGIAEGIETALAVHEMEGIPVWSAIDAAHMEKINIPKTVKYVRIYADSEPSGTGKAAAYNLQKRLTSQGFDVKVNVLIGDQWVVDDGYKMDFLDILVLKKYQDKSNGK